MTKKYSKFGGFKFNKNMEISLCIYVLKFFEALFSFYFLSVQNSLLEESHQNLKLKPTFYTMRSN